MLTSQLDETGAADGATARKQTGMKSKIVDFFWDKFEKKADTCQKKWNNGQKGSAKVMGIDLYFDEIQSSS